MRWAFYKRFHIHSRVSIVKILSMTIKIPLWHNLLSKIQTRVEIRVTAFNRNKNANTVAVSASALFAGAFEIHYIFLIIVYNLLLKSFINFLWHNVMKLRDFVDFYRFLSIDILNKIINLHIALICYFMAYLLFKLCNYAAISRCLNNYRSLLMCSFTT